MGTGRPFGESLKYFQLDVDVSEDIKMAKMEAKYGSAGFVFIIKLWIAIYSEGYYWYADEDAIAYFCANRLKGSIEDYETMLDSAMNYKLFDRKLYEKYNILTSAGVQRRYLWMTKHKRWSRVLMVDDYLIKSVNIDPYRIFICDQENRIKYEKPKIEIAVMAVTQSSREEVKPEDLQIAKEIIKHQAAASDSLQQLHGMVPTDEIRRYCMLDYDKQNDAFKETVTKKWFNSFVNFNQEIDKDYVQIRNSSYQLNIEQYKKLLTENIDGKLTHKKELMAAIEKLSGNGVKLDFVIFSKLKAYVKIVRSELETVPGFKNGNSSGQTPARTGLKIDHSNLPK